MEGERPLTFPNPKTPEHLPPYILPHHKDDDDDDNDEHLPSILPHHKDEDDEDVDDNDVEGVLMILCIMIRMMLLVNYQW